MRFDRALLLLAIAGSAALQAQVPPRTGSADDAIELARQIDRVAACIVGQNSDLGLLTTVPGTHGSAIPLNRILELRCESGVFLQRPPAFYLRGAVAERLLVRDFEAIGVSPRRRPAEIFAAVPADFLSTASPYARTVHTMLALGGCVAEAEPGRTYALFRTRIGSRQEVAAFEALAPAIAGCVPVGEEARLSLRRLRPLFAEAAYRTAVARANALPQGPSR